jgi:hypothetical protein
VISCKTPDAAIRTQHFHLQSSGPQVQRYTEMHIEHVEANASYDTCSPNAICQRNMAETVLANQLQKRYHSLYVNCTQKLQFNMYVHIYLFQ